MANGIKPEDLGAAIEKELTVYHQDVTDRVKTLAKDAAAKLVKLTKVTAPKGERGSFRKNIASKPVSEGPRGAVHAWYVKAPDYRLTHLLVKGHATRDGDRTRPDPFLANALDEVLPEYEKDVEEALKNGK